MRASLPDCSHYAIAGDLLLIVTTWLAVDAWRGNWDRVVFQGSLAVVGGVAILTIAGLPKGPKP